jgi:serine protease Do
MNASFIIIENKCVFQRRLTGLALLLTFRILFAANYAIAADDSPPNLAVLRREAYTAAVAKASPSIVRLDMVGGQDDINGVRASSGPISGLVVREDGYILTAAFNVAHKPATILATPEGGAQKVAQIVATDHNRNLTLLKIEPDVLLSVPIFAPSADVRIGQTALALGRAYDTPTPSFSAGIVSGKGRIWGKAIQTDASVSMANYGGPLINLDGQVLGLLAPLSPNSTDVTAGVEWYDSGIGFAISSDELLRTLPILLTGTDVHWGRAGFGFNPQTVHTAPPILNSLRSDGPAETAGVRPGDRILEVDATPVTRVADLLNLFGPKNASETVRLLLDRDGEQIEIEITLAATLE